MFSPSAAASAKPIIKLIGGVYSASTVDGSPCFCTYRVDGYITPDGAIESVFENGPAVEVGQWAFLGVGQDPADYEIRFLRTAGEETDTHELTNTWYSIGGQRQWRVTAPNPNSNKFAEGVLQVRVSGSDNILSEASLRINATRLEPF